jgi:hypothetical protein
VLLLAVVLVEFGFLGWGRNRLHATSSGLTIREHASIRRYRRE